MGTHRRPTRPRPAPPTATWRGVFAVREFRGLFYAGCASEVGDQLAKIALAILVYHRTHNSLVAALIYGVSYLPALVAGPLLGFVADTRPRRSVLITCDLARALFVGVMLVPGMPTAGFLALLFAVAVCDSPFNAARAALLPDVLDGELYPIGQSINGISQQVSQIVGFGVGGAVVVALTPRGALAVDVGSFLVSAVLVRALVLHRAVEASAPSSPWATITAGAREVLSDRLRRTLIGATAVSFGILIATEGLAVSYAAQLHRGDVTTGLLTAAGPAGAAIGLIAVGRVRPDRQMSAFRLLAVLWPLPLFATILEPPVAVSIALWMLAGALGSFQLIGNVLFARALTPATRGRSFAFAQALLTAAQGLGVVLAGVIAELTTPAYAIGIVSFGGLAVCGLLVRPRRATLSSTGASRPVEKRRYGNVARGPVVMPAQRASAETILPTGPATASAGPGPADLQTSTPAPRLRPVPVYAFSVVGITAAAVGIAVTSWHGVPDPPIHVSFWMLAVTYGVACYFPIQFERGREALLVSATQIVLLLGLYFGSPLTLFAGSLVGAAPVDVLRRRGPMRFLANRAADGLGIFAALATFHAVWVPGAGISLERLAAGLAALVVGDLASSVFLTLMQRAHDRTLRPRVLVRPVLLGVSVTALTGVGGLLAVTAIYANALSAVLLLVLVVLVAAGCRSYSRLQESHVRLGQLYEFQEHLGTLVLRGPSLFPVLEQVRQLVQAELLTLTLAPEPELPSGFSHELQVHVDREPYEGYVESDERRPSEPPAAVSVDLRVGSRSLGVLAAHRRLGRVRGFDASDLLLLETLGSHVSDSIERGTLLEQLQEAATHDALTGLLTLGELMQRSDEQLLTGGDFFVALLDVAGLRDVNDSLGHVAGDALLRTLGERLVHSLPEDALIARSGGGEFAVVAQGVDSSRALDFVEALTSLGNGLVQVLDVTVELRTRAGWLLMPSDAADAASAIRRADLALASAKRGLHAVARYAESMDVDGARRLRLVQDLREAIARRELTVAYQPLVATRTGQIVGAEALARWEHRELGVLSPDEFIAIAEHSGLIGDLTRLVLDLALEQVSRWAKDGRNLSIAVNLSARCLSDMTIPSSIVDLLARHHVDPGRLTLEVTETSVAEEPVRALAVLERLRAVGARLSIDDFGTGYSSLASLKRFPVHEVKLDRQFIVDLDARDADSDWAIVSAIVGLGHSLDLEIVAEGVETASTYARLRDIGVDVLQGYFIGKPQSANELRSAPVTLRDEGPESRTTPGLQVG